MLEKFLDNTRTSGIPRRPPYYPPSALASLTLSNPDAAPSFEICALAVGLRSMVQEGLPQIESQGKHCLFLLTCPFSSVSYAA
jgi:hypothetical protein